MQNLLKHENSAEVIETSTMIAPCERGGGHCRQGGHGGHSQCTYCTGMGS